MKDLLTPRKPKSLNSPTNGLLRQALVLYQDEAARDRALAHYTRFAAKLPGVRFTWWKLEDLAQPGVLAGAVFSAMRADLIVVALSSGGGLPLPFYVWVSAWLPQRRIAGGALFTYILSDGKEHHALDYLRVVARQAHMDFASEEESWQGKHNWTAELHPHTALPQRPQPETRTNRGLGCPKRSVLATT